MPFENGRYDTLTTLREIRQSFRSPPGPEEMSLTPDDVRRMARLARIAIEPEESSTVLESLNRVLDLVGQMRKVDTAGIEPMAHALDVTQRLRPDEAKEGDQRAAYQSVAPAGSNGDRLVTDGLYLVPKVIE